ncbi:MAG: prolyl oligopeptidase family serine peptidase [Ignavibacteriae bacterium]|nr:prolyl oligopeptidase family serine peptidase [Ignavibacteriota bacterium]
MTEHTLGRSLRRLALGGAAFVLAGGLPSMHAADTLVVREAMGLTLPRRMATSVVMATPLDGWFVKGRSSAPADGEVVKFPDGGEARWAREQPDARGWFKGSYGTERFIAVTLERTEPARMILEGMGHDYVYVNGTPRVGNQYQQKDQREAWEPHDDYSRVPVDLVKGKNLLLFRFTRGGLKIKLYPPSRPVAFNANDLTIPDAVVGQPLDAPGAIVLVNATGKTVSGARLVSSVAGGATDTTAVPDVPAMGVRKVPFRVRVTADAKGDRSLALRLLAGRGASANVMDTVSITIRAVDPYEARQETFISTTDGSVQYYAVMPQAKNAIAGKPALFLSLHGAGVEAINQARSYAPKSWGVHIAPTNRRPYGFSWEDWGRLDALEVKAIAEKNYGTDPDRVYLTGHSMGGHGTWFMSATYPDKFAAIGPSAGWITFQSYRFAGSTPDSSPVQRMLLRSAKPSDLPSIATNYAHLGVYIIHGDKDDNVPPQQSYLMMERLKTFHHDFEYHEEPGAGHWWDNSEDPGADCVDWRPLFDFFARHTRPGKDRVRTINFMTANPGISARDNWLTIEAQERQLELSTVKIASIPAANQVRGTTENVQRLGLDRDLLDLRGTPMVDLDGQKIAVKDVDPSADRFWFAKVAGNWGQVAAASPSAKGAGRYGTFKEAFRNRVVLVYGTGGNDEENAWAYERARYDAEKLWYQGNGAVDVFADTGYDPSKEPDRNVILYGNRRTNKLWKSLLADSPVQVDRGRVEMPGRTVKDDDICAIFVRPRAGSAIASVGAVSGTGLEGMRLTHIVRYLEPGLGLPDVTVFTPEVLTKGNDGILMTGFFGLDWSAGSGEFVVRK